MRSIFTFLKKNTCYILILSFVFSFPSQVQISADTTVYITATGKKYHYSSGCSGLSRAKKIYSTTRSSAISNGYEECAICGWGSSGGSSGWSSGGNSNNTTVPEKNPTLNRTTMTIELGDSKTLSVQDASSSVTWSSADSSIASVSSGKVTAKKVGSTTIYAKVDGKTLSCKVEVPSPELKDEITVYQGCERRLILYDNGAKVTWTSSDTNIIKLVNRSKSGVTVRAKEPGEAIVTAACQGKTLTCKVKVKKTMTPKAFEKALNAGKNMEGKIVCVKVKENHSGSAFGHDIWSGEHLNFVSNAHLYVKENSHIAVRVLTVKEFCGSWIITYKLL